MVQGGRVRGRTHTHIYVERLFELCIPHKLATFTFETQDVQRHSFFDSPRCDLSALTHDRWSELSHHVHPTTRPPSVHSPAMHVRRMLAPQLCPLVAMQMTWSAGFRKKSMFCWRRTIASMDYGLSTLDRWHIVRQGRDRTFQRFRDQVHKQ